MGARIGYKVRKARTGAWMLLEQTRASNGKLTRERILGWYTNQTSAQRTRRALVKARTMGAL